MSTQAAKHSSECSVCSVCVALFSLKKKKYRIVLQELEKWPHFLIAHFLSLISTVSLMENRDLEKIASRSPNTSVLYLS